MANVPVGLAAMAHGTSKIGDWLTTGFETVFSLPDDVQLRKTGTLFGHRVILERLSTQLLDPVLLYNLDEFYRECVIPDVATGVIKAEIIARSENVWEEFGDTNPGLYVSIIDDNDRQMYECPDAYRALTTQLNDNVKGFLALKAQSLYPDLSNELAKVAFANAVTTTQQFFAPSSSVTPVLDQIKQGAMCNYLIDAPIRLAARMNNAAQAQMATATAAAIRNYKTNTSSMYSLAMSGMPKMRNAIEMISYAIFPLIVIILVVAGQYAGTFLKGYVGTLLWVQLWPPLYAVMNYMMNLKTQSRINSMVAAHDNAYLSCDLTNWLGTTAVDDMTIAAYLTLSIPVIAWGLVQGSLQGASSAAASFAQGGGAAGARFLDNTVRSDQITAGQYNMAPNIRTGAPMRTVVGADGISTVQSADGTTAVDASAIHHRTNLNVNRGGQVSAAFQRQSEQAETAAVGNTVAAATATAAALQQSSDFVKTHTKGERAGTRHGLGDQTGFSEAVNRTQKIVDSFAEKHGLNQSQAAQIMAMAEGSIRTPGAVNLFSPVSVKAAAKISGRSDASAERLLEQAQSYAKETGFSESANKVRNAAREATFDTGDEASRRAMEGIRANLDRSRNHTDQASASYQQSLTYKELASRARQNTGAWGAGMERPFVEWMKTQHNKYSGRNFDEQTVAWIAEHDPEALTPFVEQFIKERIEPKLADGMGEMKTAEDVQALFDQGKAGIPSANDVSAQGGQWLGGVRGAAAQAGVDPGTGVDSQLPQQVTAEQGQADKAIDAGKRMGGKPLEDKVRDRTDPGTQPLLGLAATNAVAQVMPDSVSRVMMEKLPGVNMSVGTSGAAAADAAAERSRAGRPRDPVTKTANAMVAAGPSGTPNIWSEKSSLYDVLKGGSRPAPAQQQATEESDGQPKGDAPPPSGG